MNFEAIISACTAIPADWLVLRALAIFAAFEIVRAGARRVCTLALAIPLGTVFFLASEKAMFIGGIISQFSGPVEAILLGVFVVVGYFLIARIGLSWGGESGQAIQAALGGVALAAILATIWVATPALQELWPFGATSQEIFGESYRLWWLLSAYASLAYVRS